VYGQHRTKYTLNPERALWLIWGFLSSDICLQLNVLLYDSKRRIHKGVARSGRGLLKIQTRYSSVENEKTQGIKTLTKQRRGFVYKFRVPKAKWWYYRFIQFWNLQGDSKLLSVFRLCKVFKPDKKQNRTKKTKLHGLSPRANNTDRATAVCRRSDCQLLWIKGATWSAWRIPTAVFSISRQEPLLFYQVAPQLYSRGRVDPVPYPLLLRKSGSAGNRTRASESVAKNSDH
jgi:hypothetical protein